MNIEVSLGTLPGDQKDASAKDIQKAKRKQCICRCTEPQGRQIPADASRNQMQPVPGTISPDGRRERLGSLAWDTYKWTSSRMCGYSEELWSPWSHWGRGSRCWWKQLSENTEQAALYPGGEAVCFTLHLAFALGKSCPQPAWNLTGSCRKFTLYHLKYTTMIHIPCFWLLFCGLLLGFFVFVCLVGRLVGWFFWPSCTACEISVPRCGLNAGHGSKSLES